MDFPKIEPATRPSLDTRIKLFETGSQSGVHYDDSIVAMMVYIYDTAPRDQRVINVEAIAE